MGDVLASGGVKGVEDCEKPGVAVKQAMIPGFPNWHALNP